MDMGNFVTAKDVVEYVYWYLREHRFIKRLQFSSLFFSKAVLICRGYQPAYNNLSQGSTYSRQDPGSSLYCESVRPARRVSTACHDRSLRPAPQFSVRSVWKLHPDSSIVGSAASWPGHPL